MFHRAIPLLLLVTGTTGLVYEVVLGRLLALHLGSSGSSQAVTLAAFLGGLSLGAVLAGHAADRSLARLKQPAMAYALLEGLIGLWMLLFPAIADAVFGGFAALTAGLDSTALAVTAGKLATAGVLVLPLSTLMGATLPVLAAGVERIDPVHGVQLVSRYYYLNAAGAAFGALLAGFVLIERFGLELPLTMGAAVNLLVAVVVVRLARVEPQAATGAGTGTGTGTGAGAGAGTAVRAAAAGAGGAGTGTGAGAAVRPAAAGAGGAGTAGAILPWATVAFVTGFVTLCCEVVWTRLNGLLLGASVYAFAAMLFVVIAGISAGSAVAARFLRRGALPSRVLSVSQALAAAATFFLVARLAPLPVDLLGLRTRLAPLVENYDAWLLLGGGFIALHLLPAAMALGASFPALLAAASRSGARTDRATAWILASNTLGNLAGALGGGFLLMPLLGLEYALLLGGALSLLIALVAAWRGSQQGFRSARRDLALPLAIGVLAAVGFTLQPPDAEPVQWGLFRQRQQKLATIPATVAGLATQQTLFREDGKDASVVVTRYPNGILVFRTNGKADGSTVDVVTQVMLGHLGLVFGNQPAPGTARNVFVVGLGTGQTAAALAAHPDVLVTVAELSPAVVEVARLFRRFNHDVLAHPRVEVVVADAREVLRSFTPASLDLVVSEPSNPWVVGVADLYTIEHFQRVRERLKPDGVLVQWIHSYEISDRVLRSILCTLHAVFPHVAVFRMDEGDLALVAAAQPLGLHRPTASDLDAAERALLAPEVQAELASHDQAKVPRTLDQWLATQLCGPATVAEFCRGFEGPLEERFPRVEYEAPRDFFVGTKAETFVRRLDTRIGPAPDTALVAHLQRRPLDVARRAALHDFLASAGHERERPLVGATAPAAEMPVDLAAVLDALPDPKSLTPQKQARYCVWLQRSAPWVLDRQQTVLGPIDLRAAVQAWPAACKR